MDVVGILAQSVGWLEGGPDPQPCLVGGKAAYYSLTVGLLKTASSRLPDESGRVFGWVLKKLLTGPHDPEAVVVVAHGERHRANDSGMFGDRSVEGPGDVARRGLEMEDRVQDQLKLTAPRSQNGIVTTTAAYESGSGLCVDSKNRESEPDSQGRRENRDRIG